MKDNDLDHELIDQQFSFVSSKSKSNITKFLIFKLQSFSVISPYLYERFLIKESNMQCLVYHSIKLLHLLQQSDLSIILESQISCHASFELVNFCAYILKEKIFTIDIFD